MVNGLLAHRTKGRWGNTQENVFVLLSLDRYFNTYEAETPDFVARMWLGDTYAGSNEFSGRTTERHDTLIPMTYVLSETASGGGTQDLIINKTGPGRLYYRLGLQYAPDRPSSEGAGYGLCCSAAVTKRWMILKTFPRTAMESGTLRPAPRVRVHISYGGR